MSGRPEPPPNPDAGAQAERLAWAWQTPRGWRYWSAVNNLVVGRWYIVTTFGFFLFAGVLALLIRAQLAVPDNALLSAQLYNQVFTLHGSVMMFLFAVPMFEAVAIALLPQMLGARDMPFPRLSAFGYWCFTIGGVFVCGSIFFGAAPDGGWFMYPPLTSGYSPGIGADIWLLGISFIEIAAIAAAVELIVGVLKCRAPGMRLNLMPLYAWYVLVVAAMILFAFPPLLAGDILLELERALDWPFFDATRGGDPLLWQHLFWIFGHPEVYLIFLPSVGLVAMMVPTFARRPAFGYSWIVLSAVGTGFISFGLWVHHMYATGLPSVSLGLFSAASEAVAIPTGIQIFALIATLLLARRVVFGVPMLFVAGALAIFVFGGLTGVMVALVPFDWQAHDSYFIVAHLHYTLLGGMVFPVFGAIYYYYPFLTGRILSERLGRIGFWLMFVGFNVAFLPMHLTGLRGMPRRVFTYPEGLGWDGLNLVSSIGAFTLAAGIAVIFADLLRPKRGQPWAPRNPWGAGSLEWLIDMPVRPWGVRSVPEVDSRYPLWDQPDLVREVDGGRYYLADAEEGRRETLVTSVLDGAPEQCLRVPGPSFIALGAAALVGAAFIFTTFRWYGLALAAAVCGVAAILVWLWTGTGQVPEKAAKPVGRGLVLPLYVSGPSSIGWWAMFITMLADLTGFAALVFGYFFFWTVHDTFPPEAMPGPGLVWPLAGLAVAAAAWILIWLAERRNRAGAPRGTRLGCLAAAGCAVAAAGLLLLGPSAAGLDPTAHAYPAIVWTLTIWTALHLGLGAVMSLYCLARSLAGRLSRAYDGDIRNVVLYWHFAGVTVLVTVAVLALFPLVA